MTHPAFAVLAIYPLLCPSTDAILGEGRHVVARFGIKTEAETYAREANDEGDDAYYKVEVRPYREGEDRPQRPMFSAPELIADRYAHDRDLGAPEWAL